MPAIGDWSDPWDTRHDDAYLVLLGALRGGLAEPGDPVDLDGFASAWALPVESVRGAAGRVADLGMLRVGADRRPVWSPLDDTDWVTGFDHYVRLGECAMRSTAPALDDDLRALYRRRTDAVRRQAALRTEQLGIDFAYLTSFWDIRCPEPTVRAAMAVAFDRLRYGRFPTTPWSVWNAEAFLTPALTAAETGSTTAASTARHAFDDLVPAHLASMGLARDDSPITGPADPGHDHAPIRDATTTALLAAVRSGRLAPGSVHTLDRLALRDVVGTGAPTSAAHLLPALRYLRQIGVVVPQDGAVRVVGPDLDAWLGTLRLLGGLAETAAVEVLPLLDGPALADFRALVERARLAGRLREPSYRTDAVAVLRALAAHSRSRWTRRDTAIALGRLTYSVPTLPSLERWDADHVWDALDAAAGSGDVDLARGAAHTVVGLLEGHAEDVRATADRWSARMDG